MPRKKRDPKVGTGKKPKGTGRRLYTDENPKDTIRIKSTLKLQQMRRQLWQKLKGLKNLLLENSNTYSFGTKGKSSW